MGQPQGTWGIATCNGALLLFCRKNNTAYNERSVMEITETENGNVMFGTPTLIFLLKGNQCPLLNPPPIISLLKLPSL